jgi:Protein of unknown function (DUF1570)
MSRSTENCGLAPGRLDRRRWLLEAASGGVLLGAVANHPCRALASQEQKKSPREEAALELERATTRVHAVTSDSLQVTKSDEYQVVGDADPTFVQTSLRDYGAISHDFLTHFQAKGFAVKAPERRLTIVAFIDERPFREFARKFALNVDVPRYVSGFYSRVENWLVLFDFRNVPAAALGGALKNVMLLAHEATHQLTFNTGLLNRLGDAPAAFIEGLACYGEVRRMRGRNEPGLLNSERLDDLAHVQRRAKWIKLADLLTDDSPAAGANSDQMRLFYAQSWILIYSLMNSPTRLKQLQAYFKTIFPRVDAKKRLDDAVKCFGKLEQLDQELRAEAIRLQTEPRP